MPASLTEEQVARFHSQGYLVVEAVLDDADLAPSRREYSQLLDEVACRPHAQGLISDAFTAVPFETRYSRILGECPQLYKYLNISLPLIDATADSSDWAMHAGPAVFGLLRHPRILDVVESILGAARAFETTRIECS